MRLFHTQASEWALPTSVPELSSWAKSAEWSYPRILPLVRVPVFELDVLKGSGAIPPHFVGCPCVFFKALLLISADSAPKRFQLVELGCVHRSCHIRVQLCTNSSCCHGHLSATVHCSQNCGDCCKRVYICASKPAHPALRIRRK